MPLKAAIIGANGNIGLKRLKAIKGGPCRLVALCDLKFDRALGECDSSKVILEADYRKLIHSNFDLAVVTLPDHVKLPVVRDFLSAGKHVLVEKPLSLRKAEVHDLFALARRNQVYLYEGYNTLFFPSVIKLLELLQEGFLGSVHHMRLFYGHGGVHALLDSRNWRVGKDSWGGSFVDMSTHLLSLVSQFVPHMESGILERQYIVSKRVEDNCVALFKGSNGCFVELTSSWTSWRSRFSIEIYGTEGFAELEGLVKYVKYGQPGERIRYGRKNPSGPASLTEKFWTLPSNKRAGAEYVDPFSAEVEYLDHELKWLASSIESGDFDMEKQEKMSLFIADVCERFYL